MIMSRKTFSILPYFLLVSALDFEVKKNTTA